MKLPRQDPEHEGGGSAHGLAPGFAGLVALMDRLLADGGCPWDRVQTLDSLRPYLLEEAHEVLEAMDDPSAHKKELGDLLFQIVFQTALRQRAGDFDIDDVVAALVDKMVRRHPHVFGDARAETPQDVERQWEAIKRAEAPDRRDDERPDALGGVPRSLPALSRARRLQQKAAAVGFDWPTVEGALAKLDEELGEFADARRAGDSAQMTDELGDILFVLVRIAQKLGLDAQDALRRANRKFEDRFAYVAEQCARQGVQPADLGLERLEALWQEAKRNGVG